MAAVMVIYAHSYNLHSGHVRERIQDFTGSEIGFGELAVLIFFAISGYLITFSWMRDPHVKRFLERRLLRIVPALAVVTLFAAFIVGPWLTTLPLSEYFTNRLTWSYLLNVLVYPVHYHLPGVFADNPYPLAINGSIWTLRLEFSLYLVVMGLGLLGCLAWRWTGLLLSGLCLIAGVALNQTVLEGIPFHKELLLIALNGVPFFVGLFMARNPGSEKASWPVIIGLGVGAVILACVPHTDMLALPLVGYVTVTLAYALSMPMRGGDYSYGVYVWAFLVQQIVMHFEPHLKMIPFFFIATAVTFVFAALSWHFIEKPSLRHKPVTPR